MPHTSPENRDSMPFSELIAWAWRETPPVHMKERQQVQARTGPRDFVRRLYARDDAQVAQ